MNTDIRLSVGFWQHPKTFRLEKRIGLKGIRSLQILWCWCAQNRPDGNLAGLDYEDIEFVANWRGKKGAFMEACIACDWLDETDAGYQLHEWAEYNPWQAQAANREEARKEKAQEKARKAANARWGNCCQSDANECSSNASSNAQAYAQTDASICSSNAQAYAKECLPVPIPVPDIKNINLNTASGDAELSPSPPASAIQVKAKSKKRSPPGEPHYQAKSGRYLTGKRLTSFEAFWDAFDFRKGKAEAADAWLDIPELTDSLVETICNAARQEATNRGQLESKGHTPKWAQGWLSGRRWEDYETARAKPPLDWKATYSVIPRDLTPEEKAEADRIRRQIMAERRARREGIQPPGAEGFSTQTERRAEACA